MSCLGLIEGDVRVCGFAGIFILSCGIAVLQNKRLAVFRNFRVISMRFSYVILCGVYTYLCAVLRYSYPPPNRRRDAAHNLVAYFARAKLKLKEREKFGSEVPLKFLLETCRIVFWISCLRFLVNCRENLVQFARKANWNYCGQPKRDFKLSIDQRNAALACENGLLDRHFGNTKWSLAFITVGGS